MKKRIVLAGLSIVLVAAGAAVANGAHMPLLRSVSLLEVQEVEVSGAWLLAPHEAYAMLELDRGAHLYDDYSAAIRRMRAHPAVADVRVRRHFSGTLAVEVEEHLPIALLDEGDLIPVTRSGMRIPVDPARAALDLPVVRPPRDDRALVRLLEAVSTAEDGRVDVSEAGTRDGVLDLTLVDGLRVRTVEMDPWRARQLASVIDDLGRRGAGHPGGPSGTEIDLRFAGQVVVRTIPMSADREGPATDRRLVVSRGDTHEESESDA